MTCLLDAYENGDTSPEARLADRMSDLSEECYFAGWLIGTEYALWELAQAGGGRWGIGVVMPEQAAELLDLANKAGGWVAWRDNVGCVFVPMAEWLVEYQAATRQAARSLNAAHVSETKDADAFASGPATIQPD